jgi:hypothetical protein
MLADHLRLRPPPEHGEVSITETGDDNQETAFGGTAAAANVSRTLNGTRCGEEPHEFGWGVLEAM